MKLRRPPAKTVGKPPPYAIAYANVLPESHREALRDAAIAYLDECFSAIADSEPGRSYANTPSGSYLPLRIESRRHNSGGLGLEQKTSLRLYGEVHIRPDRPVSP